MLEEAIKRSAQQVGVPEDKPTVESPSARLGNPVAPQRVGLLFAVI
jgi:hypothetical protein